MIEGRFLWAIGVTLALCLVGIILVSVLIEHLFDRGGFWWTRTRMDGAVAAFLAFWLGLMCLVGRWVAG